MSQRVLLIGLILLVLPLLPVFTQDTAQTPAAKVRVLIIDGQNNHDWKATTAATKATLEHCGRFVVTVSTSPGKKATAEQWAAWRPEFGKHQVVLCNYNAPNKWPEPVCKAFLAFIAAGGGCVNVHAANNAFRNWKTWNDLIGLGWRRPNFGDRITVNDKTGGLNRILKGVGRGAGHGRRHEFLVTVREKDHPIMKGIPTWWMHAKDELYHGQRGPGENMTVLSSAWSDPKSGGTGAHEPITWVIPHGKGHVVTTVLGHHGRGQKGHDALHCVGFQTILARACEWAATGKVTTAIPKGFPKDKKTSIVKPGDVNWGT
ncbi:MAG: hypothetical protein CMJ83_01830 [Planctomycetes bacterium]|nr:hypothetical protein [Planctomycetota bacterium]